MKNDCQRYFFNFYSIFRIIKHSGVSNQTVNIFKHSTIKNCALIEMENLVNVKLQIDTIYIN